MLQAKEELFKAVYEHYCIEHLYSVQYLRYVIEECKRLGRKFIWQHSFTVHLEGDVVYVPPCVMQWMHKWYNPEGITDRREWLLSVCVFEKDTDAGPKCYMKQELANEVRDSFEYVSCRLEDLVRLQIEKINK